MENVSVLWWSVGWSVTLLIWKLSNISSRSGFLILQFWSHRLRIVLFIAWIWHASKVGYQLFCFAGRSQIAQFMGPTWGSSGADRTQVGPTMAPRTLLSGVFPNISLIGNSLPLQRNTLMLISHWQLKRSSLTLTFGFLTAWNINDFFPEWVLIFA